MRKSSTDMKNDFKMISKWADQWKISFDPDLSKQLQEVIFRKQHKTKQSKLKILIILP